MLFYYYFNYFECLKMRKLILFLDHNSSGKIIEITTNDSTENIKFEKVTE